MSPSQVKIVDLPGGDKGDKPAEKPSKTKPAPPTVTADRDLKSRLAACFTRIADAAENRGDMELAEIIREDTDVMAGGLVSLTRPIRALRTPIVLVLGIVEPVMAFSRVTRVMVGRLLDHRAERRADREPEPLG